MLLRLLGPLVVASTLVLLGTGVTTILVGDGPTGRFSVLGLGADWRGVHGTSFWFWAVITGLHLIGRVMPALLITFRSHARLAGRPTRLVVLTLVAAAVLVQNNRFDSGSSGARGPGGFLPDQLPPGGED